MIGLGTMINVVAVLVGSAIGVAAGSRLPARTRDVVTDALGLLTLLVAALSAAAVTSPELRDAVGSGAVLVVLGALVIGGVIGATLRLESRLESVGDRLQRRLTRTPASAGAPSADDAAPAMEPGAHAEARRRFVAGFVTASLVFCVGPLSILGPVSDGLGNGLDQLALKSALDGFASIAFAASLGWGVAAAAITVAVYQGAWTVVGAVMGDVLSDAQIAAATATGGLLLVGVGMRLLQLRPVPVGDLLPALVVAPLLVPLAAAVAG